MMLFNWNDIKSDPNLLIRALKAGESGSKEGLLTILHTNLFNAYSNLAKSIYRNDALFTSLVPDIIQEAFNDALLKMVEHIEANQIQEISVSIGTLVNKYGLMQLKSKLQDQVRKKNHLKIASLNEEIEIQDPKSDHDVIENRAAIFKKYFALLGERCRQLIEYRKISNLNTEEIAQKMNLSILSVNNEVFKCFNKLKEMIYQSKEYKMLGHE